MTGRFDPREDRVRLVRAHRVLADPRRNYRRGRRTIELLSKQDAPPGIDLGEPGVPPTSIPQDRISAGKFWWGYSVYFPHDPLVNTVVVLVANRELSQLRMLLSIAMNAIDLGWVVSALWLYVVAEVELLVFWDSKNDFRGAKLNATWPEPLLYVPTKM